MKNTFIDFSRVKAGLLVWLIFGVVNGVVGKAIAQEYKSTENSQTDSKIDSQNSIDSNAYSSAISPKNQFPQNKNDSLTQFTSVFQLRDGQPTSKNQSIQNTSDPMAQVTSVSQLNDVQPTDWAFQALQSLVERYGCIAGYPDNTYRGNRSLTRYEFAAGLNACLNRVNELIASSGSDLRSKEDLQKLQKLQADFAPELASLRGRVDNLETRVAAIDANRFSPTTKLNGTVVVNVQGRSSNRGDINPRNGVKDTNDSGTNASITSYVRLDFISQFAPRNYLLTSITNYIGSTSPRFGNEVTAIGPLNTFVIMGNEYAAPQPKISDLKYHWQVSDKLAVTVGAAGMDMIDNFREVNRAGGPPLGGLSRFAQRNPIMDMGFGRAGIHVAWELAKNTTLEALYSSNEPENPGKRSGLFDGNTTAAVQLVASPAKTVDLALYYVNQYASNGCIQSYVGNDCLTGSKDNNSGAILTGKPLQTDAIGASVNWRITPGVTLGGWGGYTTSAIPGLSGTVETTNYMVYLNFPDLFGKGNMGGLYVGQPPKITSSNLPVGNNVPDLINGGTGKSGGQSGTTTHIEAFYRFRVTDNIYVTPGIIHLIEPEHTSSNDSVTIGVIRSTFLF